MCKTDNTPDLAYLRGTTNYGDNVEDEWLIVYMLRELSLQRPDLWIRVYDSDGEFLLIEAAKVVPSWLGPEMDLNRVWIHDGKLWLIGTAGETSPANLQALQLREAIDLIRHGSPLVHSSPAVEAEAFYRLEKYPETLSNLIHHALVTVPRKLVHVLHVLPKLVSHATEELCQLGAGSPESFLSDPKRCTFPPVDLVTVSVRFTKFIYAQLWSHPFDPPPAWRGPVTRAETENIKGISDGQKKLHRLLLGMKLTIGFEALAVRSPESAYRMVRALSLILDDMQEDGDSALPSDDEIRGWKDSEREDSDSWMDVEFDDLDRELRGEKPKDGVVGGAAGHADLRKLVSRMEAFMNDDRSGPEGAELDDDDNDDDDDSNSEADDMDNEIDEDADINLDGEQFVRMMQEMLGLTPNSGPLQPHTSDGGEVASEDLHPVGASDNEEDVETIARRMESELRAHGALSLEAPDPLSRSTLRKTLPRNDSAKSSAGQLVTGGETPREEGVAKQEGDIDIQYNLAKNLLASFREQHGLSGPAGNILSMLDIKLPRDDAPDDEEPKVKPGKG